MTQPLACLRLVGLSLVFLGLLSPKPSLAEVRMPAIFGDHMVLQQDIKIPVWGTADAGEAVTVALGDDSAKTTADSDGKWRVDLTPVKTTATPTTLTVTGKNALKFEDVVVGDVWVCSGQSNMEMTVTYNYTSKTDLPKATDPLLRVFFVAKTISLDPQTDVKGEWKVCSPDAVKDFTAVGYYFGEELRHALNHPIGLIGSYWGGQPAQAFTSMSGLQKDPPFTGYIDTINKTIADEPQIKANFPATLAAYQLKLEEWKKTVLPAYTVTIKQWQEACTKAQASGQPLPPRPLPSTPMPKQPQLPCAPNIPTVLYNGMIAPLIPYAIKGAIWYQGEANAGNAAEYQVLFPRMISDWREKWNQGDFPFLFVQLANFMKPQTAPGEKSYWPFLRESQLKTLSLPNTGMAVIIDIGEADTIHPHDKVDVGLRLALAAKHLAYGQDVVYSGPIYDSMTVEGDKIRLSFKDIGSGLKMGTPPWTLTGAPAPTPTELTGFTITGADKNWVWAKAVIDGTNVVVSSDKVASPVAVRYGWANNPSVNLYNNEGLPASPFRTDNWEDTMAGKGITAPASPKP